MTTKIFLDLEDTIIDSWQSRTLINVAPIKDWIDGTVNHDNVLRIFSFAIWDDNDKTDFEVNLKPRIEDVFGLPVIVWPSVDDMAKISTSLTGIKWFDRTDFMQIRGKHGAFIDFCLGDHDRKCILLDDAIPNRTLLDHDRNLQIDLLPLHVLLKTRSV